MRATLGAALASLVAIAVTIGVAAQTQAPPRDQPRFAATGSAAISGVVVGDDEARAPLRAVHVSLQRSGLEDVRSTSTDDQGRYRFSGLPAGTYTLNMGKPAYVRMEYGAPKPGMPGRTVVLSEGEQFAAAPTALPRGAVIAGRLRDRNGRPVPDTNVTATQFLLRSGEREARITTGATGSSTTNAHGDYRIYGLLPGEYIVYATASGVQRETTAAEVNWTRQPSGPPPPIGRPFIYSPTWYPGTLDPQAAPAIRVATGEERLGVDFALTASPVSRVAGVVTDPGGAPMGAVTVRILPARQIAFGGSMTITSVRTATDGTFAFTNLAAGEYSFAASGGLVAVPVSPDAQRIASTLWGLTTVSVSGQDASGLAIRLQPSLSVTGQVVVKSATAPAWDMKATRVTLVASGGPLARMIGFFAQTNLSVVSVDGSFKIDGVIPGSYRVEVALPQSAGLSWSARSAMAGAVDAIDVPIEIGPNVNTSGLVVTVTDAPVELSGTITDATGRPAELYVFAFSTDRAHWHTAGRRIAFVRSTEKGTYALRSLPPGEYYLCALTELDLQMRYEAEYLDQLVPASIKIVLGEGEKKQQDLQIGGSLVFRD